MWTGGLSLRRLRVLICELPHTSRLAVAMRGGHEFEGWDLHAHLLAALVDAVQANTYAVVQVQSARRIKAPAPLPRPGKSKRSGRVVRVADLPGARATGASSA